MAHVTLTTEVSDILKKSTYEGNLLRLPPGKMDPGLYARVNKAIVTAGGKWKGGKVMAHVFTEHDDPRLLFGLGAGDVIRDLKKDRQAFYTPDDVANMIASIAEVSGCEVLEPSAGHGALVKACRAAGATKVDCFELEPRCKDALALLADEVQIVDFLETTPKPVYDRVVMNPPFTKGAYVKHIIHALDFLKPGGRLYSVTPDKGSPIEGKQSLHAFPSGTFKASGTQIATELIFIQA